jgi:hypothetical protein
MMRWIELTDWQLLAIEHVMDRYQGGPANAEDIDFLKGFLRKAKRIKALVDVQEESNDA